MNKQRRKAIEKLKSQAEGLKCGIQTLKAEEKDAYDNLPESLQGSEKGEQMQKAIDALDYAEACIDEVIDTLTEAMDR